MNTFCVSDRELIIEVALIYLSTSSFVLRIIFGLLSFSWAFGGET
jgi:hypothetical protein